MECYKKHEFLKSSLFFMYHAFGVIAKKELADETILQRFSLMFFLEVLEFWIHL